jgi:hypothetical protein
MSISFSVHEFNRHMLQHPICVIGTIWLDAQGVWLLGDDDLPAVEISDDLACEQMRAKVAPAHDFLGECLLFAWLKTHSSQVAPTQEQAPQWVLEKLYWFCIGELEPERPVWSETIQLRDIPPEYDYAR